MRVGQLTEQRALKHLREARDLVSESVEDAEFVEEALSTGVRFDHPVYDALYGVLARRNGCLVLTADTRLKALLTELRVDFV